MQHSPAPRLWTSGDTGPAFLGTCGPQGRPQGHRPRSLEGPGRLCPGAGQIWVCSWVCSWKPHHCEAEPQLFSLPCPFSASGSVSPSLTMARQRPSHALPLAYPSVRRKRVGLGLLESTRPDRPGRGREAGGKRDNPTDMGGNRGWEIPGPPGRAPGVEAPSKGGAILNRNQPFSPGCDGIDALLNPPAFFPQVATARACKPARRSQARASRRAAGPAAPTAPRTPCGNRAAAAGWGAGRAGGAEAVGGARRSFGLSRTPPGPAPGRRPNIGRDVRALPQAPRGRGERGGPGERSPGSPVRGAPLLPSQRPVWP